MDAVRSKLQRLHPEVPGNVALVHRVLKRHLMLGVRETGGNGEPLPSAAIAHGDRKAAEVAVGDAVCRLHAVRKRELFQSETNHMLPLLSLFGVMK